MPRAKTKVEIAKQKKKYMKTHKYKRGKIINKIKMESGCSDCGFNEHPSVLHFHHLNKKKKLFGIGRGLTRPMSVIMEEIKKCEVLCANCHAMKEYPMRKDAIY